MYGLMDVVCPLGRVSSPFHGIVTNRKVTRVRTFEWTDCIMDRILKKVEVGKFITTALKSILKLVELQSLVAKCCKMKKIEPCKVCEFCILLYYARKIDTGFSMLVSIFRA